jgi:hypothetical protein
MTEPYFTFFVWAEVGFFPTRLFYSILPACSFSLLVKSLSVVPARSVDFNANREERQTEKNRKNPFLQNFWFIVIALGWLESATKSLNFRPEKSFL